MPRLVEVTLKDICVQFVIKHLKNYSTEELHRLRTCSLFFIISICEIWKCEELFYINKTLELIPLDNLTHLNYDIDDFFDYITAKNLILNLPKIVDLRLRCGDNQILEDIGNSCPEIRVLFLMDARSVTDEGIKRLCQSKSKGCKIEHLYIGLGSIRKEGCLIALEKLQSLRIFEGCNGLLDLLLGWLKNSSNFPTLQLTQLNFRKENILEKEDFFFLRKVCPQLRKLSIGCKYPADDLYLVNTPWDQLEHFKLSLGTVDQGNYFPLVVTLLTNIGTNFTTLDLSFFDNTKIEVIPLGLACPNLITLELSYVLWSSQIRNYTRNDSEFPFRKLKTLITYTHPHKHSEDQIVGESLQIKFLLQNCFDLEKLTILNLLMDEDTFLDILRVNPLIHLTKFEITSCNTLTTTVVMGLLSRENDLEVLNVKFCPNIDEEIVRSQIKSCNYNVKFKYIVQRSLF